MFKKSRRKIVTAIMSILVLLWIGTLGMIYASSYYEVSTQNKKMLKMHVDSYLPGLSEDFWENIRPGWPDMHGNMTNDNSGYVHEGKPEGRPDNVAGDMNDSTSGDMPARPENPGFMSNPRFQVMIFYTVAFDENGEVVEIKNERPVVHDNEELEKLARSIIAEKDYSGTKNNLAYYVVEKFDYKIVAFMDTTVINESAATLLRYTVIFGIILLTVFFFVARYLAKRIVTPLEENYRKQKQFISDAGHELKTPVAIVSANAEMLGRQIGDNQWLSNIQYENERMGMLVGQLLELAHADNITPKMEVLDFSRLCNGEILPFESIIYESGYTINYEIAEGIKAEGNETQIKQLVSILIDNAMRHSKEGGEIRFVLEKDNSNAVISVVNSADEIPMEQRKQIFERFYRVDDARTGDSKHYGLGLAIAKTIAENHKGSIEVLCYDGLVEFKVLIPCKNVS